MPAVEVYPFSQLTALGMKRALGRRKIDLDFFKGERVEHVAGAIVRDRPTMVRHRAARTIWWHRGPERKARQVKPKSDVWERILREVHTLICTKNKRYAALRRQFGKETRATQTTIISVIATTISPFVGSIATTVILTGVTLAFYVLAKIGKEAFCKGKVSNMRV